MSDIMGLGLDVCGIERMQKLVGNERFLSRYFCPDEIVYIHSRGAQSAETLAGLFAAKEAVLKALGCGLSLPLTDIEITHGESGQPRIQAYGKAAEYGGFFLLSITHDAGVAAASVVWLK